MTYGFIGCGNMGGAIAKALSTKTNLRELTTYKYIIHGTGQVR